MNLDQIRTIADSLLAVGMALFGVSYLVGQLRGGSSKAEKDLNDTLNELLQARDKKISDLEELALKQGKEIVQMKETIEIISSKKTDLEALVILALKDYFSTHPEVAHSQQEKEDKKPKNI